MRLACRRADDMHLHHLAPKAACTMGAFGMAGGAEGIVKSPNSGATISDHYTPPFSLGDSNFPLAPVGTCLLRGEAGRRCESADFEVVNTLPVRDDAWRAKPPAK